MINVEENVPYKSFGELKNILLGVPEANYLLGDSEINSIMNEIEMELYQAELQKEADSYQNCSEMETADIIERHLHSCTMCEKGNVDGALCSPCRKKLYSEFRG